MANLDEIKKHHLSLLDLMNTEENDRILPRIEEFLKEVSTSGTEVADPQQRSQLRGLIQFWTGFIYDQTGQFVDVKLLPAIDRVGRPKEQRQSRSTFQEVSEAPSESLCSLFDEYNASIDNPKRSPE
jgi:hypothetical protein